MSVLFVFWFWIVGANCLLGQGFTELWYDQKTGKEIEVTKSRNLLLVRGLNTPTGKVRFERLYGGTFVDRFSNTITIHDAHFVFRNHRHQTVHHFTKTSPLTINAISSTYLTTQIEGSYQVRNLSEILLVVDTRDGLKARFKSSKNWIKYQYDAVLQQFIDEKGNTLNFSKLGATWTDRSRTKIFEMYKIDDQLLVE